MQNLNLNTVKLCNKKIDILNEQLVPNQKDRTYKGLKHLKCCTGQVTGDIDNIPPEDLLLCKIVCVGRSIVRRFNFDYFKYICSGEVSCLGRGKNIITKNNRWFNNSNVGSRIRMVEGLDFQHAEYPLRLIEYYNDLLNAWEDSSCKVSKRLSVIFPDISLIEQWYNVILKFRMNKLTQTQFSEQLTEVMENIISLETLRKTILSKKTKKNLKLANEDFEHGFKLLTSRDAPRSTTILKRLQEQKQLESPFIDLTNRPKINLKNIKPKRLFDQGFGKM